MSLIPCLAALLLAGCGDDATALRLVIKFAGMQLDQVSLTGKIAGKVRFTSKRFPSPPRAIKSGDDVVIRNFADGDDGKVLNLTVQALHKAVARGTRTVNVTIRKGQTVNATVNFGGKPADMGPDGPPRKDGGTDLKVKDRGPDKRPPDKGPPKDFGPPPDKGCQVGTSKCDGQNIVTCVNSEAGPAQVVKKCPLGCVGTQCRTLVPSNNVPTKLLTGSTIKWSPQGAMVVINTDSGTISDGTKATHEFVKQPSPAPQIMALSFQSISIPAGTTVAIIGGNALALVATEAIQISGIINARGNKNKPGAGGGMGGTYFNSAAGPGAGGKGCELKTGFMGLYTLGGGAGGSHANKGGKGGGGQLSTYNCNGGLPTNPYSTSKLVPLTGGSGGGRGGTPKPSDVGDGGGGGGAVMIVSNTSITIGSGAGISGGINVGGGGGEATKSTYRGGGGGGAGGGVLLEAPVVTINKNGAVAANGGGGAGGSGTKFGATFGADGALNDTKPSGGKPSAGGGTGGKGAASASSQGGTGGQAIAGGGGGGGLGVVRINTFNGSATVDGVVSASMSKGKVKTSP